MNVTKLGAKSVKKQGKKSGVKMTKGKTKKKEIDVASNLAKSPHDFLATSREEEKVGPALFDIEKKIRRANRELLWNTKDGDIRAKIQFLDALREERYADALILVNTLLGNDCHNEMFQQYKESLEGIVANMKDGEDQGSDNDDDDDYDDDDDDDDETSSSSSSESEPEEAMEQNYTSDEAEKKDDEAMLSKYGVDFEAKNDGVDPNYQYDPSNPTAGMTKEQISKMDELRAQFSSLRASVADQSEADAALWMAQAGNEEKSEEKS